MKFFINGVQRTPTLLKSIDQYIGNGQTATKAVFELGKDDLLNDWINNVVITNTGLNVSILDIKVKDEKTYLVLQY